mgnify:CR=1 FL=1
MPAKPGTIEQKVQKLRELEARATAKQRAEYDYRFDVSWIHHDCALEGVVYAPTELDAALHESVASDSPLAPAHDEIRQFQAALRLIRRLSEDRKAAISLDTIKAIYYTLAPDEEDQKGPPVYRKDMPVQRAYFHDIDTPDKIAGRMRALLQWLSSEDAKRTMHPTRIATKAHYEFLHIYPFAKHNGKVARLLMNLLLMRAGFPPAILHSTDRHRYYEALKTSYDAVAGLTNEALENGVDSAARYWRRWLGIEDESAD